LREGDYFLFGLRDFYGDQWAPIPEF
jgi:hypothetical protein